MTNILKEVSNKLHANHLVMATAESCTGGWVAKQITDLEGSSAIFDRGFVTYSNEAKQDMLGVSAETINEFGAVSEEVALEMVTGAIEHSNADIAVSISGIAGPAGGTKLKPVGTVCFGWKKKEGEARAETILFKGDRDSVRSQAVDYALSGIMKLIDN
ncbi:CinA family protein [Cocleimonas flava]|uniref:Nicotinamide-nucleotide amidase n=1 Tax=Cocleimonas flava TaxID=634765 RepID=A0A4R1F999_9GAMM|nr:nicotinamide-nucleotide amidase [Cocleimonas flava]TCJ89319.1 nicotinamide-nucleotide amidase [Cocleimonas flava]